MAGELEVKQQGETGLVQYDPGLYGSTEQVSTEKLSLPMLKLAQKIGAKTPEAVRVGDFYLGLSGEKLGRKITVNMLIAKLGRAKFKPDFTLECKSMDGVNGTTHGKCASCPFAVWKEDREDRKLNFCSPTEYSLVLVDGQPIPALLNLNKTLESAGRKLRTLLNTLILKNRQLPADKKVPYPFYKFTLESFNTVSNGYEVQGLNISNAGVETDPEKQAFLVEAWKTFKDYQGDKQFEEGTDDEGGGASGGAAPQEATTV